MDHGFQQRVGIYSAAEKIKANMSDLNENNNAIRFLGYDSILQPTLLMKLFGFMIIFGMNAPGKLKWACVFLLVTYYFHFVYCLYVDHFEQQRRLLNLNQPNMQPNLMNAVAVLEQRFGAGNLRNVGDLRNRDVRPNDDVAEPLPAFQNLILVVFEKAYSMFSLAFRLTYFFFLSIHHDWIDPILRQYDQ